MPPPDDLHFLAASLSGLRELAEELGADPERIAQSCGYSLDDLESAQLQLSYSSYWRLLDTAAEHSACPHFGLLLGQRHDLSLLGTLGLLAKHCSSFGEALQALIRYYNMASLGEVFRLERGADVSVFIREPLLPELAYSVHTQDITLSEAVQITRTLLGKQWAPTAIYLTHLPENPLIYQSIFGCPVYFNQEVQAMAFPTRHLKQPLEQADSIARMVLEKDVASRAQEQEKPIRLLVQEAIRLGLAMGDCGVETVSANLSLHSRTLHRRLRREGTTFTELLDNTRRELADHLVSRTPVSVFDISQILGYSDATAFTRSFRRWFGAPPSRWRQQNYPEALGEYGG